MTSKDLDTECRTLYCANIHSKVTEEILYELFLQAGPIERVRIPNNRDGRTHSYGFVTFKQACSIPYALSLFKNISLFSYKLIIKPKTNWHRNAPTPDIQMTFHKGHENILNGDQANTTTKKSNYKNEDSQGHRSNQLYRSRIFKPSNRRHGYNREKD